MDYNRRCLEELQPVTCLTVCKQLKLKCSRLEDIQSALRCLKVGGGELLLLEEFGKDFSDKMLPVSE